MAYTFVPPLVKPKLKPVEVLIQDADRAAYERILIASRRKALKEGAKTAKIEKEANAAIAETVKLWLTVMEEQDEDFVRSFFLNMSVLASASARNKIAKHPNFPKDLSEEIADHLEVMKAEAVRRADAAKAATSEQTESVASAKAKRGNTEATGETA